MLQVSKVSVTWSDKTKQSLINSNRYLISMKIINLKSELYPKELKKKIGKLLH
jgi:hypothetical protein